MYGAQLIGLSAVIFVGFSSEWTLYGIDYALAYGHLSINNPLMYIFILSDIDDDDNNLYRIVVII